MALLSDAAMVLFYDIAGDTSDHDDWHSLEHFHERLSVPGFLRATRWVSAGTPRYMVIYEVSDVSVSTSQGYLDRLNAPTEWTRQMMPRFRGMTRGFCHVVASAGIGLGGRACALRWAADTDMDEAALLDLSLRRGLTSAHLFRPAAPPPMTAEQALRGHDAPMTPMLVLTGYSAAALNRAAADLAGEHDPAASFFTLDHTATAAEIARTPKPPVLSAPDAAARNPGGGDTDDAV